MKNLKESKIQEINQEIKSNQDQKKKEKEEKNLRRESILKLSKEIENFKEDSKKLNILINREIKKLKDLSIKERGLIYDSISIYLMNEKRGLEKGMKFDIFPIKDLFKNHSIDLKNDSYGMKREDLKFSKEEILFNEKGEDKKGLLLYLRFQYNGIWMRISKSENIGWKKFENFKSMK